MRSCHTSILTTATRHCIKSTGSGSRSGQFTPLASRLISLNGSLADPATVPVGRIFTYVDHDDFDDDGEVRSAPWRLESHRSAEAAARDHERDGRPHIPRQEHAFRPKAAQLKGELCVR